MRDLTNARKHLIACDKRLAAWVRRATLEPIRRSPKSPYERLARAIVGQQISVAAAQTIWGRFCELFKKGSVDFRQILEFDDARLRSAGLSKQKIVYMQDLAQKVVSGDVPRPGSLVKLPDDEIVQALLPIKGVGEWTVQMLLIFHLDRPDVWPVKDLGIKKGFMKVHSKHKIPDEKFLLKFGEKFRPYRSTAARYYWKALENV